MKHRTVLVVAATVLAAAGLGVASGLGQPDHQLAGRGRCVSVTAYPHPSQASALLFVRVWEDGSVELYTRGPKPTERDEWVPLP